MRLHVTDLQIRKVVLENFMAHSQLSLEFPARGVVVLTGASGTGKSSVIDAVHWLISGETFRKGKPRSRDSKNSITKVELEAHGLYAIRTLKKSKMELSWGQGDGAFSEFTTHAAATPRLQEIIGTPGEWALRNVFTSRDLTFFSTGKDQDRKKFLEAMLNFQVFDRPHSRMLEEIKRVNAEISEKKIKLSKLHGKIDATKDQLRDIKKPGARPPSPKRSSSALKAALRDLDRSVIDDIKARVADVSYGMRECRNVLEMFGDGTCPTCGGDVDSSHLETHRQKLRSAKAELAELQSELAAATAAYEEASERYREKIRKATELEAAVLEWISADRAYTAAKTTAQDRLEEYEAEAREVEHELIGLTKELAHYKACAAAVSTTGVRAWAMADVCAEITHYTQRYLSIIDAPFSVIVSPTRQLANGNLVDEIDFQVVGAGDGKFEAASEGEQQRIAFAVRLAISSLYGGTGTLFLDEVYAHLDRSHIDGYVALINEIAKQRTTVVITHDQAFAKALGGRSVQF